MPTSEYAIAGTNTGIRVLIVDRHELVGEGIARLLHDQPDIQVVARAECASAAIDLVAMHEPDIVVIDIELPDLRGPDAAERILSLPLQHRPGVLVLTASDRVEDVHAALRAGARGYLLKSAAVDELPAAVRGLAGGNAYLTPLVTSRLIDEFTRRRSTVALPNAIECLTERENEVLRLVAAGNSNGEIAQALVVAEQTVKSHVSSIFAKTGVRDRAQAVVYGYEHQLVAVEPKG